MLLDTNKFERAKNTTLTNLPALLNVGCGSHFHKNWVNLDLISESLEVIPHDLTCGLPFPDEHFDAVYHSHVLEHLKPNDGVKLLEECFRVLKPGGIARIVVPDLERIAELYLEMHDRAWDGDTAAKTDYDWMKLELLDQLVREHSGGRMGQFMADPKIKNSEFVLSRVGDEYHSCRNQTIDTPVVGRSLGWKIGAVTRRFREFLAKKIVRVLLGEDTENAFSEGMFRNSGEIHRWMYDRFSLRDICNRIGFAHFQILSAPKSQILDFGNYQLDIVDGEIRKPDSLFTECRKPVAVW